MDEKLDIRLHSADIVVSVGVNKKDWKRTQELAKKLGRPYSASLLVRKWIREGLERSKVK